MKNASMIFIVVVVIIFTGCKTKEKETPAPFIEMKDFFRNGAKSSFRISPDGKYYSYRSDFKGKMNIYVQKVGDSTAVRVTNDTIRSIYSYLWKGDRILYLQDVGGDENYQIFSVKPDGSGLKALTPFPGIRSEILDDLRYVPGKGKEIVVIINKRVKEYFDPYSLNIETGDLTLLYENKQNFDSWVTDNKGDIRMASKTDGVNVTYMYRKTVNDTFGVLLSTSFRESFSPQSFDADDKNLYVLSNIGRDKSALITYDPEARKETKELYSNKDYDLESVFYDQKRKVLVSVSWEAEKEEKHFFDREWENVQRNLENKMPGYQVDIVSYDDARTKCIVAVSSDRLPVKYFSYDFNTKESHEVGVPFPWLNEKDLAVTKPVSYQSRDHSWVPYTS